MAINKRKVLEAARKHAQKGAQAKALKEFEKLLKLDPRDARLRLEIGDAYRRWGDAERAIETYSKVADQYMKEGFDARAVAVYKQIQNLAPEAYESYEPLAELYQRMGLTAEAIIALQTAADGYHKQGKKREALELLRKMATLDPTNTTSRIKVADLLRQEELYEDAVNEYEAVRAELERQGDDEGVASVCERIIDIEPDRSATVIKLAQNLVERGLADRAEPFVKRILAAEPDEPARYELMAQVYRLQQRDEELVETYRNLSELHRRRGDEDQAREIMQRYVSNAAFDDGLGIDEETAFGSLDNNMPLGGQEPLAQPLISDDARPLDDFAEVTRFGDMRLEGESTAFDDSLLSLEKHDDAYYPGDAAGGEDIELELDSAVSEPAAPPPVAPAALPPMEPLEDPEQLLAEASVYLRYGKRDQAIANLETIVAQDPAHRAALEKLGEAYAEANSGEKAVASWLRAVEIARAAGDAAGVSVLRDRIAAIDAAAAAGLDVAEPAVAAAAPVEPSPEPSEGEATMLDLNAIDAAPARGAEAHEIDLDDIEIDIDESQFAGEIPLGGDDAADEDAGQSDDAAVGDDDTDDTLTDEADVAGADSDASEASGPGSSSSMAQQITEDLEEADFYMNQGLADEAEAIYKRVLSIAPNHPHALVRLGEVAAMRGEDPGKTPPANGDTAPELGETGDPAAAEAEGDFDSWSDEISGPDEIEIEVEPPDEEPDALAADARAEAATTQPDDPASTAGAETEDELAREFLADMTDPEDDVLEDSAESDEGLESDDAPEEVSAGDETGGSEPPSVVEIADSEDSFSAPAVDASEAPDLVMTPPAEQEPGFDLAAELNDAFESDTNGGTLSGLSDSGDGFAAVFREFKKGVRRTLSESDHEAHFDLGIAYREMGLFEDAKGEFRAAMLNAAREIECRHMLGLCCFEQEQFEEAVAEFERIAASPAADDGQRVSAQFELGRSWEALGERENARAAYEAVAAVDPSFCEVEARLAALDEPEKPEADAEESADDEAELESFEDLLAGDDEDDDDELPDSTEAEETAEYETFDDFLSDDDPDAEAAALCDPAGASAAADPEPELAAQPESLPAIDPEPQAAVEPEPVAPEHQPEPEPRRRKKRKKISFV